ncbi:hypothetical protein Pmani_028919 [Petrolisthes manimaculis]|uniref:Carbohydrate sulfotransferase n=1 Tax=Petrolisthes manimaculis TaxID=1843537 RepID=A0AAE1P1A1_9EUCA|nr:hypothetical protein Pmani_028919 [Petrolisthes manimaculis]
MHIGSVKLSDYNADIGHKMKELLSDRQLLTSSSHFPVLDEGGSDVSGEEEEEEEEEDDDNEVLQERIAELEEGEEESDDAEEVYKEDERGEKAVDENEEADGNNIEVGQILEEEEEEGEEEEEEEGLERVHRERSNELVARKEEEEEEEQGSVTSTLEGVKKFHRLSSDGVGLVQQVAWRKTNAADSSIHSKGIGKHKRRKDSTDPWIRTGKNKLNPKRKISQVPRDATKKSRVPSRTTNKSKVSKEPTLNLPQSSTYDEHQRAKNTNKILTSKSIQSRPKRYKPQTNDGLVEFPSVSDCRYRERNRNERKNGGKRTHNTADSYPCRSWRNDSTSPYWPAVLKPTYGKVLNTLTLTHEDPEVSALLREQVKVQRSRIEQVGDTCLANPQLSVRQELTLVWDSLRSPPLVYCPLYKAGSTTWMTYFLRLKHINDNNPELASKSKKFQERVKYMPRYGGGHKRVFEEYYPPRKNKQRRNEFESSIRFLVVRHPFTRLLSAYRDKIARPNPKPFAPFFQDLQEAIVSKYRTPEREMQEDSSNSSQPTFSEFVDFIIDSTKDLKTPKDWQVNVMCWLPYWVQCGVCSSDYQVVVKLETMQTDVQFLAYAAGLKEIQNIYEWRNVGGESSSSSSVSSKYYSTLSRSQVQELYEIFRLDFELFGYSIDEFLGWAT